MKKLSVLACVVFAVAGCSNTAGGGDSVPSSTVTSATSATSTSSATSTTSSSTTEETLTEEPTAAMEPEPVVPEPVAPALPAAGRLPTSGEVQACRQGILDPATCASVGAEYIAPAATPNYPTNPDGTVTEGDITANFWNCMAAGGTEDTCRQ